MTRRGPQVLSRVEELIDPVTGAWDEELIRDAFWAADVDQILRIPLAHTEMDDFVAWQHTKSSMFTVRSAYYVEWDHQHGRKLRRTNGTGLSGDIPVWDKLWRLKVPSKVKVFLWKALHGTVPCYAVLANRHMRTSGQCPICCLGAEDIRHLLFTCCRANEVWKSLGLQEVINEACQVDRAGQAMLDYLLCHKQRSSPVIDTLGLQETIAVAAWYIWWERREFLKGESLQPARRTAMAISALVSNYGKALKPHSGWKRNAWIKPPDGFVMVSVDAGFDARTHTGTTGAVVRDARGFFIAASSSDLNHVNDACMAEASALRSGLLLAHELGCNRLIVQSDNMHVIEVMKNGGRGFDAAAAIYEDCYTMTTNFIKIAFEHCPREANSAAHELASSIRRYPASVWLDDPPDFLVPILISDVTIVD